jgi:hypothetical protein
MFLLDRHSEFSSRRHTSAIVGFVCDAPHMGNDLLGIIRRNLTNDRGCSVHQATSFSAHGEIVIFAIILSFPALSQTIQ